MIEGENMRVGMFTDSYFPQISGVSTSIKVLKDELEAQGHDVIIFTTTDPNAPDSEDGIVRLKSIPFFSFKDRRIAIKGFSKALKEAKKQRIDIVHTHTEFSLGLTGKFVAYMLKIPTIHTYHTMYEKYLHYIANGKIIKVRDVKMVSRAFCNRTKGVIVPSQLMKDTLRSYHVSKEIRVIPTGVTRAEKNLSIKKELRQKLSLNEEDIVLLSLSRLAFEKDLDKMIIAFPSILERHPNAKLVFVGDGPARQSLEELVAEKGLEEVVTFVGEVNNESVYQYYQMADVYVSASASETQGLTYLESIMNDCPVVAKENDYLKGIIKNPMLGFLYKDDHELADAVSHVIEQKQAEINQEWVDQRQELIKELSSETFGKKVISYYKHVIENYYFETEDEPMSLLKYYSRLKS